MAASAHAQDAQPVTTVADLAPITVTARGITESALDTPFMVDVVREEDMAARKMGDVEDALRTLPNVDIHNGGNVGNSFLWIRGSGSLTHTSLDDGSVDVRIDGVSNGLLGIARPLLDVEQLEVAKGPQGTLYGQIAESGVVTVKTWDPQADFDAKVGVGFGSGRQRNVEGMLNVPLGEQWSLRLAATREQMDDYLKKRENGDPLNRKTREAVSVKLRWRDGGHNDAVLHFYHDAADNFMPLVLNLDEPSPQVSTGELPHHSTRENRGVTLRLTHDFDRTQLQSTTAFHHHEGQVARPLRPLDLLAPLYDAQNIPAMLRPGLNAYFAKDKNNRQVQSDDIDQFSQEFRLVSPAHSKVGWVVGAWLSRRDRDFTFDSLRDLYKLGGMVLVGNDPGNAITKRNYVMDSRALFGEITYPLSERLSLIGGLRVTDEKLRYQATWLPNRNNPMGVAGPRYDRQTLKDTYATGRVGLRFALSPEWRVYVLQSKGHKSAGFADYSTDVAYGVSDTPYQASHILASEIGVKFGSADHRVQFGLAVYQNRVSNDHLTATLFPNYLSETFNVDTRSRGLEASGQWRVNPSLTLRGALAYTDARVTAVPSAASKQTRKGNRMPQVPYLSGNWGIHYASALPRDALGGARWFADVNLRHVGARLAGPNNVQRLNPYNLLDASLGLEGAFGTVKLWAKNLANKQWAYYGVEPGNLGMPAPGRTVGVNWQYEF